MFQAGAASAILATAGRPAIAAAATFSTAIDPRLKARALLALEAKRSSILHADVIGITDFSRPSREARFFLLDVASGRVTSHLVAHGRGSDPYHIGCLQSFSNDYGS